MKDQCVILAAAPPHLIRTSHSSFPFPIPPKPQWPQSLSNLLSMPSLGGLLKKRRTKDSQDLGKPDSQNHDGSGASMQPASHSPPQHSGTGTHENAASIDNVIHQEQQKQERVTKGKYSQEDFELQRTLGTGSFGRVHLVQSNHNHRFYAMKVLKKAQVVKMKQIEHTNDERRMLNRVRHPFLVTLWGTWQDSRNLYMVMDFVEGGELFSLLRKSQVSDP
jgi:protein kinase A